MNVTERFSAARDSVESATAAPQERNRLWWDALPMTYADWESSARGLSDAERIRKYMDAFRNCSEIIASFPFARFAGKKVLEIGCGFGAASCLFAQNRADVFAVDLSAVAVEGTRATARFHGVNVNVQTMDAERLEFEDATFDYVFSWGVLHHSHNPQAAFGQVSRVLKPNGRGLIMVYNRHSLRYLQNGIHGLFLNGKILQGETFRSVQRFYTDGYYHRHFSPRELKQCLAKERLRVDKTTITYMNAQMFYKWPKALDDYLKDKIGWLLVAEFTKEG